MKPTTITHLRTPQGTRLGCHTLGPTAALLYGDEISSLAAYPEFSPYQGTLLVKSEIRHNDYVRITQQTGLYSQYCAPQRMASE